MSSLTSNLYRYALLARYYKKRNLLTIMRSESIGGGGLSAGRVLESSLVLEWGGIPCRNT
jgi:hypothetical protein